MNNLRHHELKLFEDIKRVINYAADDLHPNVEAFTSECRAAKFARTNYYADKLAKSTGGNRKVIVNKLLNSPQLQRDVDEYVTSLIPKIRIV